MKKAAILAAGNGSRLKELNSFKPIIKINGTPLLELTFQNLHFSEFSRVSIIFNEEQTHMDLSELPLLKNSSVHYFYKSTISSMHSLHAVGVHLEVKPDEHFMVSMVDSLVDTNEAKNFLNFCYKLKINESAIMATSYIEDENPLTLKLNGLGAVAKFQCPLNEADLITSGVYYFSGDVLPLVLEMIEQGQTKMRNFLSELVNRGHCVKVFKVTKSIDIDRPEDIESAKTFLEGNNL